MIIPSIDLQGGRAVQLVGGKELALDAGAPEPLATRFALVGEVAVIDLDAARGLGSNASAIVPLLGLARCRVGGGIRDVAAARRWLDAGAVRVILGTAAHPEILRGLPRERVIVALDAWHGEVVVAGWTRPTGRRVLDRIAELKHLAGGFLVTFVEREGRMGGIDLEPIEAIVRAAAPARVTIAGGVTNVADVRALAEIGAEAQIGMALYSGRLDIADAVAAPLGTPPWPTVVVDEHGIALGLCWSNPESLREAMAAQRGVYWSRRRGLWRKGETSGAWQQLLRVDLDCDRDALRFTVRQHGQGFCHAGTRSCWGDDAGLAALARRLVARAGTAPDGSYTRRLLDDPALLAAKLGEEAAELATACSPSAVVHEAADVLYFLLVRLAAGGVSLEAVERELSRRSLRITRRGGAAK